MVVALEKLRGLIKYGEPFYVDQSCFNLRDKCERNNRHPFNKEQCPASENCPGIQVSVWPGKSNCVECMKAL